MEQRKEQFIKDQKNLLLLNNAKAGIAVTVICTSICVFFFWNQLDHKWLFTWSGANLVFGFIRFMVMRQYRYVTGKENPFFKLIYMFGIPVSGLLYSSITLYYINEVDLGIFYLFTVFLIAMINGSNLSYFIYTRIAVGYMFCVTCFPLAVLIVHRPLYFAELIVFVIGIIGYSCGVILKNKRQVIDRFGYMYDSDIAEKEKQISMARLVVGMAHEINTPLGLTVTYTSYMKDKVISLLAKFNNGSMKKSDFEDGMNILIQSHEESEKELDRVKDLVQTFKLVVPHYDIKQIKNFCLKDLLGKTSDLLHYDEVDEQYGFTIIGDELDVISYPNAIKHIMQQLIQNSVKHGFKADNLDPQITVHFEKIQNNKVRLSYQDNGVGMKEEEIKHFFDPFYRGNVSLDNKGLGGHILYNTVTQILNGTIVCGSQVNGCEFIIEFPINISEYDSLSHLYGV